MLPGRNKSSVAGYNMLGPWPAAWHHCPRQGKGPTAEQPAGQVTDWSLENPLIRCDIIYTALELCLRLCTLPRSHLWAHQAQNTGTALSKGVQRIYTTSPSEPTGALWHTCSPLGALFLQPASCANAPGCKNLSPVIHGTVMHHDCPPGHIAQGPDKKQVQGDPLSS